MLYRTESPESSPESWPQSHVLWYFVSPLNWSSETALKLMLNNVEILIFLNSFIQVYVFLAEVTWEPSLIARPLTCEFSGHHVSCNCDIVSTGTAVFTCHIASYFSFGQNNFYFSCWRQHFEAYQPLANQKMVSFSNHLVSSEVRGDLSAAPRIHI